MTLDPIVEEIHRFRASHVESMNFDLKAIFQQLKEEEKASGRTFIRLSTFEPLKARQHREERDAPPKSRWTEEDEEEMERFRETLREVRRQENGWYEMVEGENTVDGGCI